MDRVNEIEILQTEILKRISGLTKVYSSLVDRKKWALKYFTELKSYEDELDALKKK